MPNCDSSVIEVCAPLDIFMSASGQGAAPAEPDDALLLLECILCIPCGGEVPKNRPERDGERRRRMRTQPYWSDDQPRGGDPLPAMGGRFTAELFRTNTPGGKQPIPVVFALYEGIPAGMHQLFRGAWAPGAPPLGYDGFLVDYVLPATGYLELWAAFRRSDIPAMYTAAEINAGLTWCMHAKWVRCGCSNAPQVATFGPQVRKIYSMPDNHAP